jgi:hypothetical protein
MVDSLNLEYNGKQDLTTEDGYGDFTIERVWQSSTADRLVLELRIAETTARRAVRLRHLDVYPKITAFYLRGLDQAGLASDSTEKWIPTPR